MFYTVCAAYKAKYKECILFYQQTGIRLSKLRELPLLGNQFWY